MALSSPPRRRAAGPRGPVVLAVLAVVLIGLVVLFSTMAKEQPTQRIEIDVAANAAG